LVVWDGFITAEAWRRQALKALSDPNFPTPFVLGDLRTVTGHNLERLDIFDNSSLLAVRAPALPQKLALVTPAKAQETFETFRDSILGLSLEMDRFDTLDAACKWLGVTLESIEPALDALRAKADTDDAQ
jgi:hypothetical protein